MPLGERTQPGISCSFAEPKSLSGARQMVAGRLGRALARPNTRGARFVGSRKSSSREAQEECREVEKDQPATKKLCACFQHGRRACKGTCGLCDGAGARRCE